MIPFFRKIRKKMADDNKPMKYTRYAIGEILLVVIGILIALQINNWNELRKERQSEIKYYTNIKLDIETDLINLDTIIKQRKVITLSASKLSDIKPPKTLIQLKAFDSLKESVFGWRSFTPRTNTLDELISSGGLNKIKNDSIKLYLLSIKEKNEIVIIHREHMRKEYDNYLYNRSSQFLSISPFIDYEQSFAQRKMIYYTLSDKELQKLTAQAAIFLNDITIQNGLKLAIRNNSALVGAYNALKADIAKLIKFINEDIKE